MTMNGSWPDFHPSEGRCLDVWMLAEELVTHAGRLFTVPCAQVAPVLMLARSSGGATPMLVVLLFGYVLRE